MATKTVQLQVVSRNADGSYEAQMQDQGNPFGSSSTSSTSLVPASQAGVSMADIKAFLKETISEVMADRLPARRRDTGREAFPGLETALEVAGTAGDFLERRNLDRRRQELLNALEDSDRAYAELDNYKSAPYADFVGTVRRIIDAERTANNVAISLMEDTITALDIKLGAGVIKVGSRLFSGRGGDLLGGGNNTALALGAAGLGLGYMMSNRSSDDGRRRR